MIIISCRKDFSNSRAFASSIEIRNYQFLPKMDKWDLLDEQNLANQMRGKRVLILVHGFRNTLANVGKAYQTILKQIIGSNLRADGAYDLVLGFTWPGFITPLGFFPAKPFANRSAGYFRGLLELASAQAKAVDVQTHSLGAVVALQALSSGTTAKIDNLLLTAPAVDDEVLQPQKEYNAALKYCRRCIVYHSDKDEVLKFAYRIGDGPEFDRALGWKGPQNRELIIEKCQNVFVIDCRNAVDSHGGYRFAGAFYDHWGRLLENRSLSRLETLGAV
jgi:esterase/lipase superfamily enzyme